MISAGPRTIDVADERGTCAVAAALAEVAVRGDVIALAGTLGTGKTAFARAFVAARGGAEEVPSPTFTLVQIYETPDALIYHFDLYRLDRAEEVFELGFEEALAEGISLIEWPERLGYYLPAEHLTVTLRHGVGETERVIGLSGTGSWADRLGTVTAHV